MGYADPEKQKEYNRKYRLDNKKRLKKCCVEYYLKNKEKMGEYRLKNREKRRECQAKYRLANREKIRESSHRYYQENKEKIAKRRRKQDSDPVQAKKIKEYRLKNREKRKVYDAKYCLEKKEENPWRRSYQGAKQRCNNSNNNSYSRYGGRGIKFSLTKEEIEHLYFRDNAFMMDKPSIDRIDNDGDYTEKNCRYLELAENSRRAQKGK